MEAFFSNLKQDDLNVKEFNYFNELKHIVDEYVIYYSTYRPHETLKNKTPNEIEEQIHKDNKWKNDNKKMDSPR